MRLTWLGHSTVLVELDGLRIVADPLLRARVGALRRVGPLPPVAATLPGSVDAALVSHLHHDHCDLPTLRELRAPVLVGPPGSAAWLARCGVGGAVELAAGERLALSTAVTVTAVPARHSGRREPLGPAAGAVGHLVEGGSGAVWLAGDTEPYAAMSRLPALTRGGRVHAAAVPVWGWGPRLGPGHLDPVQAAAAVVAAGVEVAVPVHWGTLYPSGLRTAMTRQLTTPGLHFAAALEELGLAQGCRVRGQVLTIGGSVDVDGGA
jgi:L-ascorbate metabolism protein UlaG (beta-lactamase superfamily)